MKGRLPGSLSTKQIEECGTLPSGLRQPAKSAAVDRNLRVSTGFFFRF